MKNAHPASKSPQLSVVSSPIDAAATRMTRADVAERIGASISTVRRYEGDRLHPHVDEDGTHWFDPQEVTALAAARANEALARGRIRNRPATAAETRTKGEIAALVFERFEQRQSHAEIVIGLRIEPEVVRELFDQWCLGLTEHQLQSKKEPRVQRRDDVEHGNRAKLAARLAELPHDQLTRISVARFRGHFVTNDVEYNDVVELGGFHVAGPCEIEEITRRFGHGSYRVTAYGFDPPALRWELIVDEVSGR